MLPPSTRLVWSTWRLPDPGVGPPTADLESGSQTASRAVDYLADRCNAGLLTLEERAEYSNYVSFGTFVAVLKSKARQLLANSRGE